MSDLVRGSIAFAAVTLLANYPLLAGGPEYLQSPRTESAANPFDSALREELPPRQYGSYRFLGRQTEVTDSSNVIFAEQFDESALRNSDVQERIQQTQYPLSEPPADRAPDEPRLLDEPQPPSTSLFAAGPTRTEFTSVMGRGDSLGITTVTLGTVVEFPRFQALSVRPNFGLHALGGPLSTDLPGQLYDVSVEARLYWPFGDCWLGEFAVAPGVFTDFRNTGNGVRIVGRGIGYYKFSESTRVAIGVAYLDRQDISFLPLGGVIWTPDDDWRFELMVPRPRVAHRYWDDGDHERWVYVQGEFGGGSWAIERIGGASDIVTIRDYRLLAGIEFKHHDGGSWLIEAGYVFGRDLEYQSTLGDYMPDAAAVVRGAITF